MTVLSAIAITLASTAVVFGVILLAIHFSKKKKEANSLLLKQKKDQVIGAVHNLTVSEVTLEKIHQLRMIYEALDSRDPMPFFYAVMSRVSKKYSLDIESVDVFISDFNAAYSKQNEYTEEWKAFIINFKKGEVLEEYFLCLLKNVTVEIQKKNGDGAEDFLKKIDAADVFRVFNKLDPKYKFLNKLRVHEHYVE